LTAHVNSERLADGVASCLPLTFPGLKLWTFVHKLLPQLPVTTLISDVQVSKIESFDSTWHRMLWVEWGDWVEFAVSQAKKEILSENAAIRADERTFCLTLYL
jgi:hypothetical protein